MITQQITAGKLAIAVVMALGILSLSTAKTQAAEPDAQQIVGRSLQAFHYAGDDMRTRITMRLINAQGKERRREMTMLRMNTGDTEQRYYIYFHAPSDIKGTSLLVWKYSQQEDDRWIFIPAIKLARRIAADDKRSSFMGSDFTYEDISGRDVNDETHTLLRQEDLDGRPTYVIESRPKIAVDYVRRVSWIEREHALPLKEMFFDARDEQVRVFTANKVARIGGHWTITIRTMENMQTGHRTEVAFDGVEYGVGLKSSLFSERYLRNPPRQWFR